MFYSFLYGVEKLDDDIKPHYYVIFMSLVCFLLHVEGLFSL